MAQDPDPATKAVINPIVQSSTFAWDSLSEIPKFDYTRCGNPNASSLAQALASLEDAKHGEMFASGMAAIDAVFSLMQAGDTLLIASDIYGGTERLAKTILPKRGIRAITFDARCSDGMLAAGVESAKMAIIESPTNPTLRLVDIRANAEQAKKLGALLVVDNTFASPALQNPLALGADIVVHSTTKYVGGHSDVIGGGVFSNEDWIQHEIHEHLKGVGAAPSPFDCWLALRGLKTLEVRMRQHCANAQAVAEYLDQHPKVSATHFPGLPTHPDFALARAQMNGGFGGMVSFEVAGDDAAARRVAEALKLFILAESLGGVESLVCYPPLMSHAVMPEEDRLARGIPGTLLRLSVGLEDAQDLIEDLERALESA